MFRRCLVDVLGFAVLGSLSTGCLKANPDFVEAGPGITQTQGSGSDVGHTGEGSSAGPCETMVSQEPAPIDLGLVGPDQEASIVGAFDGSTREVWYRMEADGGTTLGMFYAGVVSTLEPDEEVCVYGDCDDGFGGFSAVVMCGDATRMSTSGAGRMGCCGDGGVDMDFTCLSSAPMADLYIRVATAATPAECTTFQLAYSVMSVI